MSIIHDALKKVEASSSGTPDLKVKPPQKSRFAFKPYLIYAPAICFGFLIGGVLFNIAFRNPSKNPLPEPISLPVNTSPPNDTGQKGSPPPLILNGIFSSQNEGYALINNRIVKEGDGIEGAVVARIGPDSVELKFEDSVITLASQSSR